MGKFYKCEKCGRVVEELKNSSTSLFCCNEEMGEILPNCIEADTEKHIPVVHEENNKVYVQVGETLHPSTEDHFIEWIFLLTDKGAQRKVLKPGSEPKAVFNIGNDEVVLDVKAYCSLHGLWEANLD